ncbi:glycosyltransferase [Pelosinus sp. sgz500959]|uniref:glycosyltransferase n=1 Tax=Pelosinus sp. sgz500959 TaxID=3242472 RepID=UPI00366FEB44
MIKKVLTIVSGAPSGCLNVAMMLADYFSQFYDSEVVLRKYNKAGIKNAIVVKDILALDYIWRLARQLNVTRPSMIIVHGYSTHLWTKFAAAFRKIPLIHVEHNVEKYTPFRRWLLKITDQYTLSYICVSNGVAKHLIKQGADAKKVNVIYNGIDIEKFKVQKEPQETYTIGMIARFVTQKDQMTLIKAMEYIIHKKKLPIQLIFQGDGKKKSNCIEYVKKHNLEQAIKFETGKFLELAPKLDLFILATHYEGLPLVLCEAMASKIPTIATNVPGVDEIIEHGVDGYLVPHQDHLKLAEQIEFCFNNKNEPVIDHIINHAFLKVNQEFTIMKMCQEYKKILD